MRIVLLAAVVCALPAAAQTDSTAAYSPFPAGAYAPGPPAPPGALITFGADGSFSAGLPTATLSEGAYVATAEHVVITTSGGAVACLDPSDRTGIYAWSLDGDDLTLTLVDDACPGRSRALTGGPLARQ